MGRSTESTTSDAGGHLGGPAGGPTPPGQKTDDAASDAILRGASPRVDELLLRGAWNRLERSLFGEPGAPTMVGRYELGEEIGSGGMGRVVVARDPKLDRTVALKLVRTDRLDAETQKRLGREARAMARVSHPNVVPVYDVGRCDELVFVAMEYVRGTNLAQWLRRSGPSSWRERLAVVCDAGRGLHAAHLEGIVHRDFKPGNVLVGDDGRVLVTDFGLARLQSGATNSGTPTSVPGVSDDPSSILTQPGMVMGTPAYMAPEQHAGLEADARADQFALCITLWEALWGVRPYQGSLAQMAAAKHQGPPARPRDRVVPRAVVSAIRRGLHPQPDQRWPTVEHLVEALQAAAVHRARRRTWILGTMGLAMAGGIAWTTLRPEPDPPSCRDAARHLEGVWDDARAEAAARAVAALELPHGAQTWARVRSGLDDYRDQWLAGHADACESAGVRGEWSPAVLDLRMACLRAARAELAAVGARLEHATPAVLEHADALVDGLTPLARCADPEALATRAARTSER